MIMDDVDWHRFIDCDDPHKILTHHPIYSSEFSSIEKAFHFWKNIIVVNRFFVGLGNVRQKVIFVSKRFTKLLKYN